MADIAKVKRNIGKMIDGGATEAEIDSYIASEGVTLGQLKLGPKPSAQPENSERKPENLERKPVFSGALLPITRYDNDDVEFDPNAGIVGSLKRAIEAPSAAMRGEFDPLSPEGGMRALEVATAFSPAPMTSKAFPASGLFAPRTKVPTRKELKKATDEGYRAARELNAEYKPEAIATWARETINQLNADGRIKETYPEVHGLLKKLAFPPRGAKSISLEIVDAIYRELGRLGGAAEPYKAATANIVQKSLDDFHANLGPRDMAGGTGYPSAAAEILKEARGNAAAGFRSDNITGLEKTIKRRTAAAGSGRNMDNQIRQRLTTFIESRKGSRGLTASEEKAIDDIIMGKPTKNALRYFGNLFGGGGGIMSTMQGAAASGLGFSAFGPAGLVAGLVPPAIGAVMRQTGGAMAKRELKELDKLMRSRSPLNRKRLGNDMPPQAVGAPPSDVPLLPSPSPQGLPMPPATSLRSGVGSRAGLLSLMNDGQQLPAPEIDVKKPMYGSPGLLFYDKRI